MSRAPQIICDCGGELPRPMPATCPHCGAVISSVRRSLAPLFKQIAIAVAAFGSLVAFGVWLLTR